MKHHSEVTEKVTKLQPNCNKYFLENITGYPSQLFKQKIKELKSDYRFYEKPSVAFQKNGSLGAEKENQFAKLAM